MDNIRANWQPKGSSGWIAKAGVEKRSSPAANAHDRFSGDTQGVKV